MKYTYIVRSTDPSTEFDDLSKAKKWMCSEIVEFSEKFDAMGHGHYLSALKHAKSLKELADIWNAYTDLFIDGSEFIVKEIYLKEE